MAKKATKKLITDPQYQGRYVALTSSGKKSVVASGFKLGAVVKKARQQGVEFPAIVFVPKKGATCLY